MNILHGARPLPMTVAVLTAAGLAACGDATGPAASPDDDLDLAVATVAAEATLDDVRSLALGTWGLSTTTTSPPHDRPAPGDALERTRTLTFYNADGQPMDGYHPLLTASINLMVHVEGSLERPMWSGEVDRHRDVTVSGLAGEETERTWNGTGSDEHSRVRVADRGDMERHFQSQTIIEDVVVGVPRSEHPWPLSGTITRHVEVTVVNGPHGGLTRFRTVVVTFNGTQYVTLSVNGEEFEVDLADRDGRRPHRPGRP